MEAALLLLFALAVLLFVVPSAPASPEPPRIVVIEREPQAAPGLGIILFLLVLIVAVVLIGQ
jgi:hypothetical protein